MEKLPRKLKKRLLGERLTGKRLRSLLGSVKVIKNGYPISATILPYPFCPKCGCRGIHWSGNRVSYPERWESGYCARCEFHVVESDNSPYYHALEFENYTLTP